MKVERATENDYVPLLRTWVDSIRKRFRLSDSWDAALVRLDRRLVERPASVTAFEVGRLFQPLEVNRVVTIATPGADRAIHFLIEAGRNGPMEKCSPELREWFRKHYMWSTQSMSMQLSELNTHTSDEALREYFNVA